MVEERVLATLLAWFSPAFPVGAFSYSHGLEHLEEMGALRGRAAAESAVAIALADGAGRSDLILLAHAWRAEAAGDAAALGEVLALALALAPSAERWEETVRQGNAFAEIVDALVKSGADAAHGEWRWGSAEAAVCAPEERGAPGVVAGVLQPGEPSAIRRGGSGAVAPSHPRDDGLAMTAFPMRPVDFGSAPSPGAVEVAEVREGPAPKPLLRTLATAPVPTDAGVAERGRRARLAGLGDLPYPVAVGVAGAQEGLPLGPLAQAFAAAFVANLVSAAVRLVPLGQTDGQRIVQALGPLAAETARDAIAAPLDAVGGAALGLDVSSMAHECQEVRLFRS